jgi:hypothetical protein
MASTNPLLVEDGQNVVVTDTVAQPERAAAVTPSNSTTFAPSTLYVGTGGDLRVTTAGGDTVTFSSLANGFFPVKVVSVFATGTTASNIIRLFNP